MRCNSWFFPQLVSNLQSRSLRTIKHNQQNWKVTTSSIPTSPPTIYQHPFQEQLRHDNPTIKHKLYNLPRPTSCQAPTTQPSTPTSCATGNPQPAMVIPPPRLNSGIPRHPLELVSGFDDEWRRCPLCWQTKLCVALGRCVIYGKRVKAVLPQNTADCCG